MDVADVTPEAAVSAAAHAWKAENPPPEPATAPGEAPPSPERLAIEEQLAALGAQEVAGFFITAIDVAVRKVASVRDPGSERHWALTDDERSQLLKPATKVAELYMPTVRLHPVTALALTAATVYGAKYVALEFSPADLEAVGNQPATAYGGKGQPAGTSTNGGAA